MPSPSDGDNAKQIAVLNSTFCWPTNQSHWWDGLLGRGRSIINTCKPEIRNYRTPTPSSVQSVPAYPEPSSEASLSKAAPALTSLSVPCFSFNTFKPNISKSGFAMLTSTSRIDSRHIETTLGTKASHPQLASRWSYVGLQDRLYYCIAAPCVSV